MNKTLYQFCQKKFKTQTHGKLKLTGLLKRLYNGYGFGFIKGDYLLFNENDRAYLIARVQYENGVHLFRDPFPEKQSREQSAQTQRNEKAHSYAVSRDFVLLNALKPLQINQQQLPLNPFTSLGVYLKADEIISVEHPQIILVENLEIMANLKALNIPESLHSALWLYRGDAKKEQQTGSAYQFFRRYKESHQLICFSDLDPAGIQIALTSGADYWLTAEDNNVIDINLHGDENEWFKQAKAIKYLEGVINLPEKCRTAYVKMRRNRKTLKQEHMLAHNVKLELFEL